MFAALGGLLFGYDTGVISGAELFFRNEFTLSTFALEVIVSGVLAGAAVGALAGGRLADLFGRRKLLIATAIIFAAGAILCAAAPSAVDAGGWTHHRRLRNRIVLQRRACIHFRGCSG